MSLPGNGSSEPPLPAVAPAPAKGVAASPTQGLAAIPYKECIQRAEAAIARLSTCDDIDEHVKLVKEAEGFIREAQNRIQSAEGEIQRILGRSSS